MCKGLFSLLILFLFYTNVQAQSEYNFSEEENINAKITDVQLNTSAGGMMLSNLYNTSPVILALVFSRCTGICSPFLLQLSDNIRTLNSKEKFKVLVVSFDPIDSLSDLEDMDNRLGLNKKGQWTFATTKQIDALNSSVGFRPRWDSLRKQFDHDALLVGINENGYIAKKLIGLRGVSDMKKMIQSIHNEFIPSYPLPRKNNLLSCFTYDPSTGKRKPSIGLLILVLPVVLTFGLILWLAIRSKKWRRATNNHLVG